MIVKNPRAEISSYTIRRGGNLLDSLSDLLSTGTGLLSSYRLADWFSLDYNLVWSPSGPGVLLLLSLVEYYSKWLGLLKADGVGADDWE